MYFNNKFYNLDKIVEQLQELDKKNLYSIVVSFCEENSYERPMRYEEALDFLTTKDIETTIRHVKFCPKIAEGDAPYYYFSLDGNGWLKAVDLDEFVDTSLAEYVVEHDEHANLIDLESAEVEWRA